MSSLTGVIIWLVLGLFLALSCIDFAQELFNYYLVKWVRIVLAASLAPLGLLLLAVMLLLWWLCHVTDR